MIRVKKYLTHGLDESLSMGVVAAVKKRGKKYSIITS